MKDRFTVVLGRYSDDITAYIAPYYANIDEGDIAVISAGGIEAKVNVVGVKRFNMNYDNLEFEFLVKALGATLPLAKVVAKIVREDFGPLYEEEEEDE